MDKVWIFFVLLGITYVFADSALKHDEANPLEDLNKAYDDDWYPDELEKLGILRKNEDNNLEELKDSDEDKSIETGDYYEEFDEAANLPSIEEENSKNLEEEVKNLDKKVLLNEVEEKDNQEEVFDENVDYQIEDNRSELKYKENDDQETKIETDLSNQINDDFEGFNVNGDENKNNELEEQNLFEENKSEKGSHEKIDNLSVLFDETKDILNEDDDNNDFNDLEAEGSQQIESHAALADETKSILEEPDTFLDDEAKSSSKDSTEIKKDSEDLLEKQSQDHESVKEVYEDLQKDLDTLVQTWKKLQESDEDSKEHSDGVLSHETVLDYEEKYGRPFKEGIILQQRDYDNLYDENLSELLKGDDNEDNLAKDTISLEKKNSDEEYEQVNDSNLSQIFNDNDRVSKENVPNLNNDMMEENENKSVNEAEAESIEIKQAEGNSNVENNIPFENDALIANENPENNPKKPDSALDTENRSTSEERTSNNVHKVTEMNVNELSADELEKFMTQFDIVHNSNVLATDCDGTEGPIHKRLSVDEALIISSCNFPNAYPTNKVMDWIVDGAGNGMGIEINVTDMDLNGAIGDYVLIKPGQVDASGSNGLVFSFHLNSMRMYRFLDVNRIFIRFEAFPGWSFRTGFRISVKLVEPLRDIQPEQAPQPEALIPAPTSTLIVNLGGVAVEDFLPIEEEFRRLVADMAAWYIHRNEIDPGLNTTLETAQIVSRSICNIRWPNFENCTKVEFGVPLVQKESEEDDDRLDEDDLIDMWNTCVERDPFAARLRRLGVVEFVVPNDSTVLTVWVVIAVGVVISMGMLAFALWRFSCFEDYTRMAAFNDSDSLSNEKRGLDLYPTPHQTLPPLYSDVDYKWADDKLDDSARVDMGGFTNKSYVQDDLFNLDSDDEVIASRERSGQISARGAYSV